MTSKMKRELKKIVQVNLQQILWDTLDTIEEDYNIESTDERYFLALLYANQKISLELSKFDDIYDEESEE